LDLLFENEKKELYDKYTRNWFYII
jgi:hypothetical protein